MSRSRRLLRRLVKGRISTAVAYHIAANQWRRLRVNIGRFESKTGSTLADLNDAQSLSYIARVREDYARYGALDAEAIKDRHILEIGVGDNFGLALLLLADGAASVTCLDRFYSIRNDTRNVRIYRALIGELRAEQRQRLDGVIRSWDPLRFDKERLRYVYGVGLEEAESLFPAETFGAIVSRAVLQQVSDLPRAMDAMDRLLAPGARYAHQIDLRDQGIFTATAADPLTFLTVPDWLNTAMASHTGQSNRHLVNYYRDELTRRGHLFQIRIMRVLGQASSLTEPPAALVEGEHINAADIARIEAIRPKLLPRYQSLSCQDLLTASIFLAGSKGASRNG